jgi:SAM-dependent methyltransferase
MHTLDFERLNLRDGLAVLDLGCGQGRHIHGLYYAADMTCLGMDLSLEDVLHTRAGFDAFPDFSGARGQSYGLACADALHIPLPDASLDRVICSEVLEHLPDYKTALAEINRITRPGGMFALSVPRAWPERICWNLSEEYHNTPGGHVRIFNAKTLRLDVEKAGFRYLGKHYAHGLHAPYWWLKCLLWERRDDHPLILAYKRFLEWDILAKPLLTRGLEALAAPLMGKSVVMYFERVDGDGH